MATVLDNSGRFEIGRVFGRTFTTLSHNILLYLGLSVLLTGLPTLLLGLVMPGALGGTRVPPAQLLASFMSPSVIIAYFVVLVGSFLLQAALIRATIEDMNGNRPDFAACLATGFRSLLPIVSISLLIGFGVGIGFMLFLVPGIILALMWSVSIPAHIEERSGVIASLGRSRALTKGSRWPIFGLFIIMFIVIIMIQAVLSLVLVASGSTTIAVVGGALVRVVTTAIFTTAIAVTYVELRTAKEGASVSSLAEIFA